MAEEIRKGFKDKDGRKVGIIAKVINAITGHFAGLNNNGEVVDSGYGPSDFARETHTHNIEDVTHLTDALAGKAAKDKIESDVAGHVLVEDGEVDIDAPHGIHLHIVDESGESDVQHDVDINAINVAKLEDALASVKIPLWDNGVYPFETSNGTLVLVSDITKYNGLFANVPPILEGKIYYSTRIIVDDSAVFLALCEAETKRAGYLEFEMKKVVTMFVGGYTLVIQKGVISGTVTLKTVNSLDAILSASVSSSES